MVSKFIPSSVSTVSTNPYQLHIYLHIYLYISIYPYLHPQLQLIEKPQAQGFLKRLPWRSSHRGRLHKDLHTGSHQPVSEESGLIDKFKSLLFQFFPHGDPSKFASLVFRVFDENNVGKLFLQPLLHCYIVTLGPSFRLFLSWRATLLVVSSFFWQIGIYLAENIYFVLVAGKVCRWVNPCEPHN